VKVLNWKSRFAWSFITVRRAFRAWTGRNVPYSLTFQSPVVNMYTVRFSTKSFASSPYGMLGCAFGTILSKQRLFPLHSVHRSLLLMDEHCILCEVRTESSCIIWINFGWVWSHVRLCEVSGGKMDAR